MNAYHARIIAGAAEGALVLTVNNRLSRYLQQLYDGEMVEQGKTGWKTPSIQSLDHWLKCSLAAVGEDWRLLDRFAALRLWETVIEKSTGSATIDLLQISAAARLAFDAHQQLEHYRATPSDENLTEDQGIFLRWRKQFIEICRRDDWLDPARLIDRVAEIVEAGKIELPDKVLLAGFDEVTPAEARLCRALTLRKVIVEELPPPLSPVGRIVRIGSPDTQEEIRHAARWARGLLSRGEADIGIVVPRLYEVRNLIRRIFREEIDPASLLGFDTEEDAFGLSLGDRLADQGPVTAALDLLGLDAELPIAKASRLLRSPYLAGSMDEGFSRALLDVRLRSRSRDRVQLSRLAALASRQGPWRSLRFARICGSLVARQDDGNKRGPGDWAEFFTELLQEIGWPGQRPANSREYQILKAWREKLMPAFVGLETVSAPLCRKAAAGLLHRLASEIEFQTEAVESPIQVVGHLEAAGLSFRHLWVLGLAEDVLPAPASPNPFLPNRLQSAFGMPHADGDREMAFARKVVGRLFASAPNIVVSYPQRRGDCELRPSPLISNLPEIDVDLSNSIAPVSVYASAAPDLTRFVDDAAPELEANQEVKGGTAVLQDQALCPFRAFAHHRLHVKALEFPRVGIDPRIRGSLIHTALESFWRQVRSRDRLLEMSEVALHAEVMSCVRYALDSQTEAAVGRAEVLAVERDRMAEVILEWLEIEKERTAFTVVEFEKEYLDNFGGLTLKVKVDRTDRLAGGDLAIIDYKTGQVDLAGLLNERLIEPQLAIYGNGYREAELGGVGFAIVRRGECALEGVCRDEAIFPGVQSFADTRLAKKHDIGDWSALLDRWRRQLDSLGEEFIRGRAAVAPIDQGKACRYCDLKPLCRIDERGFQEGME